MLGAKALRPKLQRCCPSSRLGRCGLLWCSPWRPYTRPSFAPKPLLDLKHIAQNPGLYEQNCKDRNHHDKAWIPWRILDLRQRLATLEEEQVPLRTAAKDERKKLASLSERLKNQDYAGEVERLNIVKEVQKSTRKAKQLKTKLNENYPRIMKDMNAEMQNLAFTLPNLTSRHTPSGNKEDVLIVVKHDASHQAEVRLMNAQLPADTMLPADFMQDVVAEAEDVKVMSHVDIAADFDLIDFKGAAKSSGWGWYFLKNQAAMLEQALIQYALQVLRRKGFTMVSPPSMVYAHIADACGFQPRDQNGEQQTYSIESGRTLSEIEDKAKPIKLVGEEGETSEGTITDEQPLELGDTKPRLTLAATAEVPLAGMYADHDFVADQLPLRTAAVSRCYRAEAGARGKDTKGLYRVHEFSKVEMFAWTMPDSSKDSDSDIMFETKDDAASTSDQVFHEMVATQQEILTSLGLHYRLLEMPSTDLGGPASRKQDIEAWFPSRGWGEVTSTSICTDYQSRRLCTRVRDKKGKLEFPYTINGTALAVPRVLAAIIETHYDASRKLIYVPKVLMPWMAGIQAITPNGK